MVFKRYFRLFFPCLATILLAYGLMAMGTFHHLALAKKLGSEYTNGWLGEHYRFVPSLWGALRSAIWNTFFYYDSGATYNNVLWSITIEWKGSLLLFALFGIAKKNRKRYILYGLVSLVAILFHELWVLVFVFGFLLCDLNYTGSQGPIEHIKNRCDQQVRKHPLISFIVCMVVLFFGHKLCAYTSLNAQYGPILISFVILYGVLRLSLLQRLLSNPFFVWLGHLSFGLYLLHIPILFSVGSFLYLTLPIDSHVLKALLSCLATGAISLVAALLFTRWIDKPSIRLASRIGAWMAGM